MPRVRLAESTKRPKSSAKSTDEFGSSNADGLEHFSDYDEFNFDAKSSGITSSNAVQNVDTNIIISSKAGNPYKKNSTISPPMSSSPMRSPTISSKRITIKDLAKKPSKSSKGSKSKGYTKLYNSSIENDENDELNLDKKSKGKKKKQIVSFEESDDSSIDLAKESSASNEGKSKSTGCGKKRAVEKQYSVFDEDLSDTDEEEKQTAKKPRGKPTKDKGAGKKPRQSNATKSKATKTKDNKDTTSKASKEDTSKSRPRLKSSSPLTVESQILPHRIVAVDNRALPSIAGDSITRQFLSRLGDFMLGALDQDVLTASSGAAGDTLVVSMANGGDVGAFYLLEGLDSVDWKEQATWLSDILTPINCGFGSVIEDDDVIGFDYGDGLVGVDNESKTRTVEGFTAKDSWSYFGDMVEAARCKVTSAKDKSTYALSIFTMDASLFADTDPDAHLTGFNLFQKRVSKAAVRKTVTSVTILIADATSDFHAMKSASEYGSYQANDGIGGSALPNRLQTLQCINLIRRRIQELPDNSMKIKLEFVDGTSVDFQTLLQIWTREGLAQTYQVKSGIESIDGKLQFELPETIDGTMCSISLDLQYTVLPDRIDSHSTMELVKDMKMLSSLAPHAVEVVQTVPLACVDSSLIYGVPMYARPGLEHDLFQYNQMKILVRQLWKYLSRNDVALVLRVKRKLEGNGEDAKAGSKSRDELFLLASQAAVKKQSIDLNPDTSIQSSSALDIVPDHNLKGESPCQGILYRYATKKQILHFGNEEPDPEAEEEENTAEVAEYADYIERSMDMLTSSGLNPFLVSDRQSFGGSGYSQSQDSSSSIH